jgi:hypothetical protein
MSKIINTMIVTGGLLIAGAANAQTYCMPAAPIKCKNGQIYKNSNWYAYVSCELINGQCILSGLSYTGNNISSNNSYHTVNTWLGTIVGEAVAFCARGGGD